MKEKIHYLHTNDGSLVAVQIPAVIWRQIEPFLDKLPAAPETACEDMEGFQEFMAAWNFPYKYKPRVSCPGCGANTDDWQTDPQKPFELSSADISGHLVFHCKRCGATIRQKYFKDHMDEEFTLPASSGQDALK